MYYMYVNSNIMPFLLAQLGEMADRAEAVCLR